MSIDGLKKRGRGRPQVDSEVVRSRVHRPLLDALDAWARDQADQPDRAETVRRLLADHLRAKGYLKP
ncbi:CopG family transcriptional regulator [Methylorubrum sp. Q1]|nr:CopG family transcriptional regulator [Methylorubrum sp. Q1]